MATYLIIGDGAARMAAAQTVRAEDAEATVTVLSDEPSPYYYRAALTNYLLGQLRDEQLWGVPPGFYRRHRTAGFLDRAACHPRPGRHHGWELSIWNRPTDGGLLAAHGTPRTDACERDPSRHGLSVASAIAGSAPRSSDDDRPVRTHLAVSLRAVCRMLITRRL